MPTEENPLVASDNAVQRAVNATQNSAAPSPANQDNTGDHGTHQGFAPEYLDVVPTGEDGETVALLTEEGVQGDTEPDAGDAQPETLTGDALKERARELDIDGRGSMTADELREAIAAAEAK